MMATEQAERVKELVDAYRKGKIKEKEREFDYSEERENIIKEKTKELESEIPEGAEKIRTWTSEKTVDKNVVLVIYYEIVLKING